MATGCGWTIATAPAGVLTLVPPPDNCGPAVADEDDFMLDFSEEANGMFVALLEDF